MSFQNIDFCTEPVLKRTTYKISYGSAEPKMDSVSFLRNLFGWTRLISIDFDKDHNEFELAKKAAFVPLFDSVDLYRKISCVACQYINDAFIRPLKDYRN